MFREFSSYFPGLYALINNAGVCVCGEFDWQTWDQIQKQVDVNLLGSLRVTKHFLPLLKAGEGKFSLRMVKIESTWKGSLEDTFFHQL